MPVYDFECFDCKEKVIDALVSRETKMECPRCGRRMTRLIGAPLFKVHGANAAGGYSDCIGDIEKFQGREFTMNDLDD